MLSISRAASTASTARVRLLTLADVPAVRKVCEGVYGGADYLPLYIYSWIKAKNFVTLGLELENTLIGTSCAHIDPEKQLAVLKGIRIHPDYRNQRLYGPMLAKGILSHVAENVPIVKRFVTSTEIKTKEVYSQRAFIPGKWKELHRSAYFSAQISSENIQSPKISELLQEKEKDVLSSELHYKKMSKVLLPADQLASSSSSYRIILQNSQPYAVDEKVIRESVADKKRVWLLNESARDGVSLSHGVSFVNPETNFIMWSADVYCGNHDLLPPNLIYHVKEQFKLGYNFAKEKPFLFDFHTPEVFADDVREKMHRILGIQSFVREGRSNVVIEMIHS